MKGLVYFRKAGWTIVHKCLHFICRMSVVLHCVQNLFCSFFLKFLSFVVFFFTNMNIRVNETEDCAGRKTQVFFYL